MMKNKSTLAKLLAEEDVYVVHKQMPTAYFDSKKRELGLPIWKDEEMTDDIYDLMVCHEIGHALWTPLDMLEKAKIRKLNHSFVNILEDARIEKMVKGKYAGSVGVFNRGYVDLVKKDFFGTAKKNIASMNLIDRINVFFKSADTTIPFSDEEKVWVDRTASTKTPDDVLDLAEELYAWMDENSPETDTHENGMPMVGGESGEGETADTSDGDGESEDGPEGSASGVPSDEKTDGEDKGSSSGDGESDEENADEESDSGKSGSGDAESDDETEDSDGYTTNDDIEGGKDTDGVGSHSLPTTDSAFGKAMDELRDKVAENNIYGNIPKVNLDKIIVSPKTLLDEFGPHYLEEAKVNGAKYCHSCLKELETLKSESKKTVSYMVKEFEMKKAADQYARAATSKTGSLDMGKLHTYKYNEDLFKKVTTIPGATNHGMVLVLDWSGSMNENLKGTLSQLFNLVWFCRRIKIPFEVFAFSDAYARKDRYERNEQDAEDFKCGDLALSGFKLLNFFSSDMNNADEMTMMHILWMFANRYGGYRDWSVDGYPYSPHKNLNLGGTPLNDAIIAMMDFVPKYKKSTGVQKINTIFLTDGQSHRLEGVHDYRLDEETGEHHKTITHWNPGWYHRQYGPKVIITDPVVNKTYEIEDGNMTNDLLKMLKNRVYGMNVVGFFIAGTGRSGRVDKRTLYYLLPSDNRDKIMDMIKFVNKNKFLALKQLGYDEYYVLPGGNALAIENETLGDEFIGASKAKLKTAFGKMAKGKILSRPLLNKFVALVA